MIDPLKALVALLGFFAFIAGIGLAAIWPEWAWATIQGGLIIFFVAFLWACLPGEEDDEKEEI